MHRPTVCIGSCNEEDVGFIGCVKDLKIGIYLECLVCCSLLDIKMNFLFSGQQHISLLSGQGPSLLDKRNIGHCSEQE